MQTPEIRPIPAETTHDLRHRVLRPHQPLAEMAYPGDDDPGTFHLGAFPTAGVGSAAPVGIVSMYAEPMPKAPRAGDLRLRGMAVEPGRQGQGLGAALVAAALKAAREAGGRRVWCNARTSAAGFYSRLGFTVTGEPFDLPGIGEHYVMWIGMNQSHPDFLILGYSETAMLLAKEGLSSFGGFVSIRGQRDPYLQADIGPRLDLSFDDTPPIDESDEIGRYRARELRRKAADVGLLLRPPSVGDVEAIIDFSERLQSVQQPILFQCFAGISRSAGAALVALSRWHGPGNESLSVQTVLDARPAAQPHMGLVRLADAALSRNGRLVAEVERVQKERL